MKANKDIFCKFESVAEFARHLESNQTQTAEGWREEGSHNNDSTFCGTESYEQATELMIKGDEESFKKLKESGLKTNINASQTATGRILRPAVCGAAVNVPAYLSGRPNCMIQQRTLQKKARVLNVVFSNALPWTYEAADMIKNSILVLKAVQDLEKQGIRVNLYVVSCSKQNKKETAQKNTCLVKIKDAGQHADYLKIAYFICNPSFFRRHVFRFREVTPGVKYCEEYGYSVTSSDIKKIVSEHVNNAVFISLIKLIDTCNPEAEIYRIFKEYRPQ